MKTAEIKALVIVFDGVEEVEALTPVDILRRANFNVTIASVSGSPNIRGRNDITFLADTTLDLALDETYDLLVLPGGPGVLELLDNQPIANLLISQNTAGADIAAICAAPKLLAKHGILSERNATSHSSVRADLPHPSEAPVVEDKNIITSQGVGTAIEFSLALVRRFRGDIIASEIAASIHS